MNWKIKVRMYYVEFNLNNNIWKKIFLLVWIHEHFWVVYTKIKILNYVRKETITSDICLGQTVKILHIERRRNIIKDLNQK